MGLDSRRNALLGAATWFYVKRRLRRKGAGAMGIMGKLAKVAAGVAAVGGGIWLFLKRGRKGSAGEA
jgi:hypothetical protein